MVVRDADYRAWRLPDAARDSLLVLLPGGFRGPGELGGRAAARRPNARALP